MNKTYCKLSEHLFNNIDNHSRVDEGLSDFMKKIFGGFGFIGGLLSGKDKKDKMSEAMAKIMDQEMKDEERRMQDELDAEENLEIAKMQAEAEANKKRLDAVSQRKVDALNAKKRKLDNLKENIKKGKLFPTAEQTAALIDEINKTDKDLTLDEDHPVRQLKDAAMMIMVKPDGSIRDPQEIDALMQKTEGLTDEEKELKKNIEGYNKLAEKHQKPILDGMNSPAFKEDYMKSIFETARIGEELKNEDDLLKAEEDAYKEKCEAQAAFGKAETDFKNAEEAYDKAKEELNKAKSSPFIKSPGEDGTGSKLSNDDFKTEIANKIKSLKNENPDISNDDISKELKKLGMPSAMADKIKSGLDTEMIENDDYSRVFNNIENADITDAAEKTAQKANENISAANSVVDNAKTTLDNTPDPNTEEGLNKIINNADTDTKKKLTTYQSIPKEEKESGKYDPTSKAGKDEAKRLETDRKKMDEKIKENENQQATRKQQRERAANRIEGRKENILPDGINKNEIETALDGLEAGEIKKDGKIGIMVDNKFIEKPKSGSDKEDEYIAKREKQVLEMDVDKKSDIKTVKKDPDNEGKYIIVKVDKDGNETEEKGVDKQKATEAIIAKRQASLQTALVLKQKQDLKDKIGEVLKKDGTIDAKKFNELSDAQKNAIANVIDDPEMLDSYFDGTGEDLKDIKDNLEKNADKYLDAVEAEDLLDDTVDNSADSDYDDDDAAYDSDETEEDTAADKAVDKSGKKLKRGEDGKWYREEDFNEDGSLKDGAASQKNVATKNIKLKNPAKEWHRRKKKNGDGKTKSYYKKDDNGEWISISQKEYRDKVTKYKEAKARATQNTTQNTTQHDSASAIDYTSLKNWLFEHIH